MIALDISKSMMAEDIIKGYNRLDVAKLAWWLITGAKGDHVRYCCFCRKAYKQPSYTRLPSCSTIFEKYRHRYDFVQGTDIGNAIDLCMSSFNEEKILTKPL